MIDIHTLATTSLGDRSYLAHDGRVALVIDPQRDIDRVPALADGLGVRITHVAETHIHNDYVTGGLELAELTGAVLGGPAIQRIHTEIRRDGVESARMDDARTGIGGLLVVQVDALANEHRLTLRSA